VGNVIFLLTSPKPMSVQLRKFCRQKLPFLDVLTSRRVTTPNNNQHKMRARCDKKVDLATERYFQELNDLWNDHLAENIIVKSRVSIKPTEADLPRLRMEDI